MSNPVKRSPSALELTSSLFSAPPAAPAPVQPVAPATPDVTPTPPADAEPPAPPAAPPAVTPPPPPAPAQFSAASVTSRFTGPAAPAEPVAPVVPPAEDTNAPSPTPQAQHAWAELRTQTREFKRQAETLSKEVEQARQEAKARAEEVAKVAAELEESRRREQELTDRVGRLSLAESPEFQKKYDLRGAEVKAKLQNALVRYTGLPEGSSSAAADKLLAADPKDLPDLLSEFNPSVAGMILGLTAEMASIDEARSQELSNWRQTGAAAAVLDARKNVVESAASRRRMSDEAIEAARAYGNPVYSADDPAVKETADAIAEEFHGFVQTATEEQLIRAAAEGYSAPYLYEVLNQQQAEIAALREQLTGKNRAAMPPLFAGAGTPFVPAATPPPTNVVPAKPADSAREFALGAAASAVASLRSKQP